mmetsp:Transcript_10364/g.17075  ORF Transcript_10364/g.17075 Transcript_10364/m.17075 type:complete len:109 (+) Transcript_10364:860-1186(+)
MLRSERQQFGRPLLRGHPLIKFYSTCFYIMHTSAGQPATATPPPLHVQHITAPAAHRLSTGCPVPTRTPPPPSRSARSPAPAPAPDASAASPLVAAWPAARRRRPPWP